MSPPTSAPPPAADAGDVSEAVDRLCAAAAACSEGGLRLGAGHALRLAVARQGMDAAIAAERWEDAAVFSRAVSRASRLVYPAAWPVVGLSLARLAKLELTALVGYTCSQPV
ncbi:unnamed protein product [Prorocentrum cordatum]|uniref:Uncharacterized protein n=1 Tax=Prorocentrum cordatum TaxID=2364126 RepID=A0ABN9RAL2_9DINO|nr:unnamed protein product [Polarella glacialis]